MAREVNIMTPEHVELRFELAGIGSRFIALLVDMLLQGLVILILALLFLPNLKWVDQNGTAAALMIALMIILLFAIMTGYFLFFEATRNGQTPGKKSVGIRVIRDTGHPIDFRAALLRNVMRIVDSLPGVYGVGILSVFFSPQYRRLGDYVAGTLVVKVGRVSEMPTKPSPVESDVLQDTSMQTQSILPPETMPYISSISKDEYRTIRHFLIRRSELELGVADDLAKKLAEPIARRLETDPAQIIEPIAFLEAVSSEWERRVIH